MSCPTLEANDFEQSRSYRPLITSTAACPTNGPILERPSAPFRTKLYISHFLSTWNSRVFEFGAVLFLSTSFPGTLLPASVYALSRAASVILFSSIVGNFIDHEERMHVVRISIVGQRVATALSCGLLWLVASANKLSSWQAVVSLSFLSLLAGIEKINSVMNTISVERDWVVIIAQGSEHDLQELNSQMRRLDLSCKLVGPLAIALLDGVSSRLAISVILAMTCVSISIEYFAIAKVYQSVEALQRRTQPGIIAPNPNHCFIGNAKRQCNNVLEKLSFYVHHRAFLPSLSLSLLYLTVLSFGGQMIAYLLSIGFTSTSVGLLRTISTVFELSATWLAPKVINKIGPVRGGIWFLNWQLAMVSLSGIVLWLDNSKWAVAVLLAGVILSRVGLWGFDLCAQIIIQESVEPNQRGSFSALEASAQSAFELLSFAATIIFARPEQFKYPAAISASAVTSAAILYALLVRKTRGHLFHPSKCMKGRDHAKGKYWRIRGPRWEGVVEDEAATEDCENGQ